MSGFCRIPDAEYERVKQQGFDAKRHGKRAGDCPYRGHTPKVKRMARAWQAGFNEALAAAHYRAPDGGEG